MKAYIIDESILIKALKGLPKDEVIEGLIFATNDSFTKGYSSVLDCLIFYCENKPIDSLIWGIFWKESPNVYLRERF